MQKYLPIAALPADYPNRGAAVPDSIPVGFGTLNRLAGRAALFIDNVQNFHKLPHFCNAFWLILPPKAFFVILRVKQKADLNRLQAWPGKCRQIMLWPLGFLGKQFVHQGFDFCFF
ncbi:hypothetical protein [Lactobacillus nasalidis]|nr:hypothetical protein [Lactobacillus nasalidis]